jgi:hypothetical protein
MPPPKVNPSITAMPSPAGQAPSPTADEPILCKGGGQRPPAADPCRGKRAESEDERLALVNAQAFLRQQLQQSRPGSLLATAWDRFFDRHTAIIKRAMRAYHVPDPDRDDLLQDVWLAVIQHLGDYTWDDNRPGFAAGWPSSPAPRQ